MRDVATDCAIVQYVDFCLRSMIMNMQSFTSYKCGDITQLSITCRFVWGYLPDLLVLNLYTTYPIRISNISSSIKIITTKVAVTASKVAIDTVPA